MNKKEFEKLLKPDKYQVFLFRCQVSFPLNCFSHHWFVISYNDFISRYEILGLTSKKSSTGYLHLNKLEPYEGHRMFFIGDNPKFESALCGVFESKKMFDLIKKSILKYPYLDKYDYIGPNSNTYIQWIINQFPESQFKLGFNALGKSYKK